MRHQALLFLSVYAFPGVCSAQQDDSAPVTCTQFIAWTAGGMSSQRLNRLAHERGIAFALDAAASKSLLAAGRGPGLAPEPAHAVARLRRAGCRRLPGPAGPGRRVDSAEEVSGSPINLAEADCDRSQQCRSALCPGLRSPAAGRLGRGSRIPTEFAEQLMPGLSDIHSRLAYLLYRSDDADGAIAEARTALSIDPRNAEAYRFLGLGLYANGQYAAAVHAFQESLARQPNNADVYYDMGITLRDQGNVDAAAAAYRKAIALNPAVLGGPQQSGHAAARPEKLRWRHRRISGGQTPGAGRVRGPQQSRQHLLRQGRLRRRHHRVPRTLPHGFRLAARVTAAWLGRSCPSATTSPRSWNSGSPSCRIRPAPTSTVTWGRRFFWSTGSRRRCANCAWRCSWNRILLGPSLSGARRFSTERTFKAAETEFRQAVRLQPTANNHYYLSACLMSHGALR